MLRKGEVYKVSYKDQKGSAFDGVFYEGDDTWVVFAAYIVNGQTKVTNAELIVPIVNVAACAHMPDADLEKLAASSRVSRELIISVQRQLSRSRI